MLEAGIDALGKWFVPNLSSAPLLFLAQFLLCPVTIDKKGSIHTVPTYLGAKLHIGLSGAGGDTSQQQPHVFGNTWFAPNTNMNWALVPGFPKSHNNRITFLIRRRKVKLMFKQGESVS